MAYDQFLERTANMRPLPPTQHYGECEAVGPNNELGCDILNDDGSPNPPTLEDGTPNVPTTLDPCRNIPANLTCHVVGGDPSLAQTNYDSGYKLGVYDAKLDKANKTQLDFVSQPGKELSNYTRTLKDGYAICCCLVFPGVVILSV